MSDDVKIERGIPVPSIDARVRWPWKRLEVGDSFLAEGKKMKGFQPYVSRAGTVIGRKFICRSVEGGVRVWRVA